MSTNVELATICKSLEINHFIGVLMMDELAKLPISENESYIINLQNSDQQGSHWTAVYKSATSIAFFDSFGAPVPLEIRNRYESHKIYNFQSLDNITPSKPLQNYSQVICGHLCVLFLLLSSKGLSFKSVITILQSDINTNNP